MASPPLRGPPGGSRTPTPPRPPKEAYWDCLAVTDGNLIKEGWQTDKEFRDNCLAFTGFGNRIQSKFGTNHWIETGKMNSKVLTKPI
jgi:hypothetical protein